MTYHANMARKHQEDGYVYLLRIAPGLYKIGRARHVGQRIKQHLSENPSWDIELIHVRETRHAQHEENKWHYRFKPLRAGLAELFRLSDDDVQEFCRGN